MSHTWTNRASCTNESCHAYERSMSRRMSYRISSSKRAWGRRASRFVAKIGPVCMIVAERLALPKLSSFPRRDLKVGQRDGSWLRSDRLSQRLTISGIDELKTTILLREHRREAGRKLISAAALVWRVHAKCYCLSLGAGNEVLRNKAIIWWSSEPRSVVRQELAMCTTCRAHFFEITIMHQRGAQPSILKRHSWQHQPQNSTLRGSQVCLREGYSSSFFEFHLRGLDNT